MAYVVTDQKVHDREFGNLLTIRDNFTKIVVSMDEMTDGRRVWINPTNNFT